MCVWNLRNLYSISKVAQHRINWIYIFIFYIFLIRRPTMYLKHSVLGPITQPISIRSSLSSSLNRYAVQYLQISGVAIGELRVLTACWATRGLGTTTAQADRELALPGVPG